MSDINSLLLESPMTMLRGAVHLIGRAAIGVSAVLIVLCALACKTAYDWVTIGVAKLAAPRDDAEQPEDVTAVDDFSAFSLSATAVNGNGALERDKLLQDGGGQNGNGQRTAAAAATAIAPENFRFRITPGEKVNGDANGQERRVFGGEVPHYSKLLR